MKYACKLSKNRKTIEKAKNYFEEVIENLEEFQFEIQNQTIIQLIILKSLKEKKDFKKKNKNF